MIEQILVSKDEALNHSTSVPHNDESIGRLSKDSLATICVAIVRVA